MPCVYEDGDRGASFGASECGIVHPLTECGIVHPLATCTHALCTTAAHGKSQASAGREYKTERRRRDVRGPAAKCRERWLIVAGRRG
eukprot:scaffold110440_cov31-Tisochrysis_lutea.AAC.1